MKYSLANYILSIEPNDNRLKQIFGTISIGGEGSYLGSITLSLAANLFSTKGYATGAWVHDKNLDRHGTAKLSLNQLSETVAKFIQLAKLYYTGDYEGCTLSVTDINGNKVATGIDCYIESIPDQEFRESAGDQTWSFTCGQINYA